VRYIFMPALSIVALGAMGLILSWFFRRLKRIESERWGKTSQGEGAVNVH